MAFNDDEKPQANKLGLVRMTIPMYSKKDVALTADSVKAVVELKATSSATKREGLDLVAVVDVSGSMGKPTNTPKINNVKRALQFVIMKLTPVDRLSIVTFAGTAERLVPLRCITKDTQDELKGKVGELTADGKTTDIKTGLELGLAVLADRVHTESRTANIFLMSDGKVKGGGGDPTQTDPGEVPVYTFGFGKGTDHKLLNAIAMNSVGGTYSSVPDGKNLSVRFAELLGGLLTVVAQDVQLTLKPKTTGGDLDKMVVVPGTGYTRTTDASGTITIKFGTIFSGETRKVAVEFTLKESTNTMAYNATLAVARHSYAAQETHQPAQNIVRKRKPNPSSPASAAGIDERWVNAEVARRNYAGFISEAINLADKASEMAKKATEIAKKATKKATSNKSAAMRAEASEKLGAAQNKLQDAQDALENIMVDDDNKMVKTLRAELQHLSAYMTTHDDYDEFGRPYALATITSHNRQRTAGRGDKDNDVSLYVTKRMITYVQQANKFEENPEEPVPTADEDVKKEIAENSLAAIATPLNYYLDNTIQALQGIQKLVATAST